MPNVWTDIATAIEYPSASGRDTIHGWLLAPEGKPRGILQISHGMVEHMPRYDGLAKAFCAAGWAVCGNDHLGHGATSADGGTDGFFAEKNGAEYVLADLHTMTEKARAHFGADLPVFLLGHSMGSFFARWYAERFGGELAGLILSGTAGPNPAAGAGRLLVRILCAVKGPKAPSPFIEKMMFGSYCSRIPDAATGKEWVTGDADMLADYLADPKCGFAFTLSGYGDLLQVLTAVNRPAWAGTLPKGLPVLLVAGEEDPVGGYGAGVRAVADRLKDAGLTDVQCRLYPGCRHEVHHEGPAARAALTDDVLQWLDAHAPRP